MEERLIPILKIAPYIRYVNDIIFWSGHVVYERVIYDHEFIFGMDGEAVMEYDGQTYRLGKASLFYLRPGIRNLMRVEADKTFHAHCVHFDWMAREEQYNFTAEQLYLQRGGEPEPVFLDTLRRLPTYELSDLYLPPLTADLDFDQMAPLFSELYRCYRLGDIVSQAKARACFLQIISNILAHQLGSQGIQRAAPHRAMLTDAIHFLRAHYDREITTPMLAARFSLSPKYFGVLFKAGTGMSVRDFLLDIRIQRAKQYLLDTSLSIEEVADSVGIHDAFYFTKLFKQREGIPPGRYRRMLAGFGIHS